MFIILTIQNALIGAGIFLLGFLPFSDTFFTNGLLYVGELFNVSFFTAFLVMIIRPLADILQWNWLRRLVILRKGLGIFSASIIVGLAFGKIITPESTYFATMFSPQFFSFTHYAVFAHLGDVAGFILLITSNTFSQRLLRGNWKRVQRLSYVYFFAGGIYEAFAFDNLFAFVAMVLVMFLTFLAWWIKLYRRQQRIIQTPAPSVLE